MAAHLSYLQVKLCNWMWQCKSYVECCSFISSKCGNSFVTNTGKMTVFSLVLFSCNVSTTVLL